MLQNLGIGGHSHAALHANGEETWLRKYGLAHSDNEMTSISYWGHSDLGMRNVQNGVQWNLSIVDTLGTAESVLIREVSSYYRQCPY